MSSIIRSFADAIDNALPTSGMADFQRERVALKGLKRRSTRGIFSARSIGRDYAFHSGGRDELQFNIGTDEDDFGNPRLRVGIAFSLEPSQSLPDTSVLQPLIDRFNIFTELNGESFAGLRMWHFRGGKRSADYPVGILQGVQRADGTFVFLGDHGPVDSPDPKWALEIFERLLPLYPFVQGGAAALPVSVLPATFRFAARGPDLLASSTSGQRSGGVFDIALRHNEIQLALYRELVGEYGAEKISYEATIGGMRADMVAQHDDGFVIYETKVAGSVRACLRQATGQLLEYAFWSDALRPCKEIVVVGEPPGDPEAIAYIAELNRRFPVKLSYRCVRVP